MSELYTVVPYGTKGSNTIFSTLDEAQSYADWLPSWVQPALIITPDKQRIVTDRGAYFYEKHCKSGDFCEELFCNVNANGGSI